MSAVISSATELLYFGKVPSRGDFVRSAKHASLITSLDQWQSQTMDRLAADPRWKLVYDAAPSSAFAILSSGSSVGLAGYWMASQDASGRRFPFITAGAFDLPQAREFVTVSPLALSRLWARLEQVARVAHAAVELEHAQASLNGPLDVDVNMASAQRAFEDFLETHTVASLTQMLAASGSRLSVRQATLAMGMLLQPAMTQGAAKLTKVLYLPLVGDSAMRGAVASWWLALIMGFFSRHTVELGLFLTTLDGRPHLVVGFQGASAATLHAVMDPSLLDEHGVTVLDAEWVEEEVDADYGLRKLSNYLRDPGLSLAQALSTYREVFLGV